MANYLTIPVAMKFHALLPLPMVEHTRESVYDAIVKAADHIEQYPGRYDYQETSVPRGTSDAGCMLGRIAQYHGGEFCNADAVAPQLLAMGPSEFFREIAHLMLGREPDFHKKSDFQSLHHPRKAAAALRHFANRFRPKHIGLPAAVVDIFNSHNEDATV
jgi:hypothetical protein